MAITTTSRDGVLVVRFNDTRLLDETKIDQIDRELLAAIDGSTEERVVVDFASVQFMSSSMLGKLVKLQKKCKSFKVKLRLAGVSPEIREVFKITRLDKLFDIDADVEAACKALSRRRRFG